MTHKSSVINDPKSKTYLKAYYRALRDVMDCTALPEDDEVWIKNRADLLKELLTPVEDEFDLPF